MAAIKARQRARTAFDRRDQEIVGLKEIALAAQRERDKALAGKAEADKAADFARGQAAAFRVSVDALKGELAGAHATIERQAGYVDRVHEADALSDQPQWQLPHAPLRPGPHVAPNAVYVRARGETDFGGRVMRAEASLKPWWAR